MKAADMNWCRLREAGVLRRETSHALLKPAES